MARSHWTLLAAVAALGALPGCVVRTVADTTAYPPTAYSAASPYAAPPSTVYGGAAVAAQPYDSYCAEAVDVAQSAAAQAAVTGSGLDARRAQRTAGYAQRDC
jgi:hypothetical protein